MPPSSPLETAPSERSALVLFSGGQDSTACLIWALKTFERVETIGFDYGQRHHIEMVTRMKLLDRLRREFPLASKLGEDHVADLRGFGAVAESSLTRDTEMKMSARGLPNSFVPGRNLVFFVYAAAVADRRGIDHLVGGMCETDFSGYPDCRKDTLLAMQQVLVLGVERPFIIDTPLMYLTKAETWAMTYDLGGEALIELVLEDTHTCYMGERGERHKWGYGCGHCPACELRAKGYEEWQDSLK
jgi:7-cyano-7-deazaguanine synthase